MTSKKDSKTYEADDTWDMNKALVPKGVRVGWIKDKDKIVIGLQLDGIGGEMSRTLLSLNQARDIAEILVKMADKIDNEVNNPAEDVYIIED